MSRWKKVMNVNRDLRKNPENLDDISEKLGTLEKWGEMHTVYLDPSELEGIGIFIENYLIYTSQVFGPGLYLLLHDQNGKQARTMTRDPIMVDGFRQNEDIVHKLIREEEMTKLKRTLRDGKAQYVLV